MLESIQILEKLKLPYDYYEHEPILNYDTAKKVDERYHLTGVESKVSEFGINNALVELYVTIKITEELVAPVTKSTQVIEYDVLIASKVINGRVPSVYGGMIVEESGLLSIPIE